MPDSSNPSLAGSLPEWPAWTAPADTLTPEPGAAGLPGALAWLEALAERDGWPSRMRFALTLCADEALTNIVTHARPPDAGQPLRLWLRCGPTAQGVALCIEDDGAAFDPTAQASPALAPSLDEAQVGGHGLRLMRHYLRQMLYRREGPRNLLLLEVARPD